MPLTAIQILIGGILIFLIYALPFRRHRIVGLLLLGSIIAYFGLQIAGQHIAHHAWSICLRREIATELLQQPCEPSAQFKDGSKTFELVDINWKPNRIPLYFMNDKLAFNYYLPTQPNRDHLPYNLQASTNISLLHTSSMQIQTTLDHVEVSVNGEITHIQPNQLITIPLANGSNSITVQTTEYHTIFDAMKIDIPSTNPFIFAFTLLEAVTIAILSVSMICAFIIVFIRLTRDQKIVFASIAILLALSSLNISERVLPLLCTAIGAGFYALFKQKRSVIGAPLIISGVLVITIIALEYIAPFVPYKNFLIPYAASFLPLLAYILLSAQKVHLPKAWAYGILFIFSWIFISHTHQYGSVVLFPGGNDELTHEGYARIALLAPTWRGFLTAGEPYVFYYQPLYRYILAGFHYLFGESMFGPYVIQTLLCCIALHETVLCISSFAKKYTLEFFIYFILCFGSITYISVIALGQSAFQQSIALPALLYASMAMIRSFKQPYSKAQSLLIAFILGVAISIRTDFIPVLIVLIPLFAYSLYSSWHKKVVRGALLSLLSFCILPASIIVRNIIIAGQIALMPTSGLVNLTSQFVLIMGSPTLDQLQHMSYKTFLFDLAVYYSNHIAQFPRDIMQNILSEFIGIIPPRILLWAVTPLTTLVAIIMSDKKHRIPISMFLLIPMSILIPSIFFDQHNGVAMLGVYDYFFLLLTAIATANILSFQQNSPPENCPYRIHRCCRVASKQCT